MMAAVFSTQGAGQFLAAIVALVVTVGFRKSFTASKVSECDKVCQLAADKGWRIIIGFGALPALVALYYRITIPETPRFTFDVAQDIEKADADIRAFKDGEAEGHPDALKQERTKLLYGPSLIQPKASWNDFFTYFGQWKNGSLLFATMASWFCKFSHFRRAFDPWSPQSVRQDFVIDCLRFYSCRVFGSWNLFSHDANLDFPI